MPSRSTSAWAACALAGLVLLGRCSDRFTTALEVIDSVVDRDGDTLFVEDILEGFGSVPVSVDFSPVTDHMFIGFKAGGVRIYPDGGSTTYAATYDSCVDMEDDVYENNDLGLLNFRLHPDWPDEPYGYMLYTHDPGYDDDCLVETYFCEKDHRLARVEVVLDESTNTVTCGAQAILINDWCTGSNHHGGGGMAFMENGDMALTVGDMSKAEQVDAGDDEANTCLVEDAGLPQGNFRAQLDDFNEGKLLRISADALLADAPNSADTTGFLVRDEDFWLEAKGFRNPFRLVVLPGSGDIVIADVGLNTAESLKVVPNPLEAAQGATMGNYGWPCMEGNAWIPPDTNTWLVENENDACDAVRGTTLGLPTEIDYDDLMEQALAGEVDWVPASYTYSSETMDSDYPDLCANTQSSVSAVHIYQGGNLPDRYSNALFVGDYSKDCVFYFDVDADAGTVDWTSPHVLFDSRAIVDFNTDPKTGILYAIDAKISVLIKITATDGPIGPISTAPDVVLEADVTNGTLPLEVTLSASASSADGQIVTLKWDCEGDGIFEDEGDWSKQASRTHVCTYDADGVYEATVQATDSLNATASDSVEILAGDVTLSMSPTPAPSAAISEPPVSTPAPIAAPVGEPLTSPPELQWKVDNATGVRSAELEFGVVEIDNFWGYTITRGYNGQMPGPTMRMESCRTYNLTVKNTLTLPNPGGDWNTMKDPNTTNVHTHGLHISGESPADDVLFVEILPGEEHTYVYTLPCDHAGGTFWYHPHHHGSTALQAGGGAMGVLIVEDRRDIHGIPGQYSEMPELVLAVQEMYPDLITFDRDAAGGELFNTTATARHYLVNGMVVPTLELEAGKWMRLRISFAGQGEDHAISLQNSSDCEMGVLAKDGVYLGQVPRMMNKLFFTPASRVDVAVRCPAEGDVDVGMEWVSSLGNTVTIAALSVASSSEQSDADLESWEPCRPYYLEDLVNVAFDQSDTENVLVRETIGDELFVGPNNYLFNLSVDEVQQWNLQGSTIHPFHMHVNHMQYSDVSDPGLVPGWNRVGDWIDTVAADTAVVRFRTERYGGHVTMHCHVNSHSDTGIMAVVYIEGGEGPNENPIALAPGTCGTEDVLGYGYSLDEMLPDVDGATPSPSVSDEDGATTSPSVSDEDGATLSPSVSDEDGTTPSLSVSDKDGATLSPSVSDEDDADVGALGRAGGDSSGDPENDWWITVVAGAAIGLGVLSVGLCVYARCRGKGKGAPTKVSVEDGDGNGSAPETKGETKAEAMSKKA